MVKVASSFGRSGTHDFILLRASAIILLTYVLFLVSFFVATPQLTFDVWAGLFSNLWMKVYTLLALTALLAHGWIGVWQVLTDYVKNSLGRGVLQFIVSVALIAYWLTGLFVLWGV
ncbi:MAG: succinate dehydrogenase, hydrophobic membrane anchor protein [Idiomarina sp.]|nr:succinate dehydrogenase, hydrophobic membrane anchor protein [Idiomarina sp.]